MSGWHSLADVGTIHVLLRVFGLLAAAAVIAAGMTAYHFWSRWDELVALADRMRAVYAPRWRPDMPMTLHNAFAGFAIVGIASLLSLAYAASAYGNRKSELIGLNHAAEIAREQAEQDTLRRTISEQDSRAAEAAAASSALQGAIRDAREALREATVRHLAESAALRRDIERAEARRAIAQTGRENEVRLSAQIESLHRAADQAARRHAAEIAGLRKTLEDTNARRVATTESLRWEVRQTEAKAARDIAELKSRLGKAERKLASLQEVRRLSIHEKNALIDALSPFAGQRVLIAAIEGDEDGRGYAADFAEVFEAAGWQYPEIAYRRWERDPVGVEIALNENDGRAGRINSAIGALINVTRKLALTDANTIYMNGDVPSGQVEVKIGKKLMR